MDAEFVRGYKQRALAVNSVLCVGLDPTPEHVPPAFGDNLKGMEDYLYAVIEIAATKVPIVKLQYACYAAMGPGEIAMIPRLVRYALSQDLLVILDGKRGDVPDTMEHYGNEVFGQYGVDACTFNPFLGETFMPTKKTQSWMPWFSKGKCAISLIRTSNPEAKQLQDLRLEDGKLLYEHLAVLVGNWNASVGEQTSGLGCVGGVVGATWPDQARRCRALAGDDVFFLIPGYGAQGGDAAGAVIALRNSRGDVMGTVNSSRAITLYSWCDKETGEPKPGDPLEHVATAIDTANKELNAALAL